MCPRTGEFAQRDKDLSMGVRGMQLPHSSNTSTLNPKYDVEVP